MGKLWRLDQTAKHVAAIPALRGDLDGQRLLRDPMQVRRTVLDRNTFMLLAKEHPGVILALEAILAEMKS